MVVLVLVACFIFCIFKKCFGKKKKPKKVREGKAGRRRKAKEGEGEAGEKVRLSLYYIILSYQLKNYKKIRCVCVCFNLIGWGGEERRGGRGERTGKVG